MPAFTSRRGTDFREQTPLSWKGTGRHPIPERLRTVGPRGSRGELSSRFARHPVQAMPCGVPSSRRRDPPMDQAGKPRVSQLKKRRAAVSADAAKGTIRFAGEPSGSSQVTKVTVLSAKPGKPPCHRRLAGSAGRPAKADVGDGSDRNPGTFTYTTLPVCKVLYKTVTFVTSPVQHDQRRPRQWGRRQHSSVDSGVGWRPRYSLQGRWRNSGLYQVSLTITYAPSHAPMDMMV